MKTKMARLAQSSKMVAPRNGAYTDIARNFVLYIMSGALLVCVCVLLFFVYSLACVCVFFLDFGARTWSFLNIASTMFSWWWWYIVGRSKSVVK